MQPLLPIRSCFRFCLLGCWACLPGGSIRKGGVLVACLPRSSYACPCRVTAPNGMHEPCFLDEFVLVIYLANLDINSSLGLMDKALNL